MSTAAISRPSFECSPSLSLSTTAFSVHQSDSSCRHASLAAMQITRNTLMIRYDSMTINLHGKFLLPSIRYRIDMMPRVLSVVGRWSSAAVNYCMRRDDGRLTWLDIDAVRRRLGRTCRRGQQQNTQASSQTRLLYNGHVTCRGATKLGDTRQRSSDFTWHCSIVAMLSTSCSSSLSHVGIAELPFDWFTNTLRTPCARNWRRVNPLKGRGVNWLHFAIQV